MKVAVFGIPQAIQIFNEIKNSGGGGQNLEIKYVVQTPSIPNFANPLPNVQMIPLAAALQMYREQKIDAFVLTSETVHQIPEAKNLVKNLKFRGVDKLLCFISYFGQTKFYWLDIRKSLMTYLEANLIDACNLNCKACTHFANLFSRDEIYPLDEFKRDIESIARSVDVMQFRLLGGEPFLLKNLDEYVEIARRYFPQTLINIVTNGLLIPTVEQKIFDAIRRNSISVDISEYPPTTKIKSQIVERLKHEGIRFEFMGTVEEFSRVIDNGAKINNAALTHKSCGSRMCRFIRHGKIYKCPIDALKFRFADRFKFNYPPAIGVDLHATNFTQMLEMLDGVVDQCYFCAEHISKIPWTTTSNPKPEDWIA